MKVNSSNKVFELSELLFILNKQHPNKTIGLCHGVFDVLHSGHIFHFEEASEKVDILIVSVTSDKYVNKGPGRPINNLSERIRVLASIEFIDYIVESNTFSAVDAIKSVKPTFYFKGLDYAPNSNNYSLDIAGNLKIEEDAVRKIGGLVFFTTTKLNSSSSLINSMNNTNTGKDIIEHVKKYFRLNPIDKLLEKLSNKKISIIGEIILDEFIYTESLGKSGKHPIVAEREVYKKTVWGGICPLVSTFETFLKSDNLSVISVINSQATLNKSKSFKDLILDDTFNSIIKTRFINEKTNTFMYEIYDMEDKYISENLEQIIIDILELSSLNSDLLVALDFGHGLITPRTRKFMSERFNNFALNVQKNAGNKGFSNISKYNTASLIVMNGEEVELELKQKGVELSEAAKIIHKKMNAKIVVITDGANGLVITNGSYVYKIPSLFSGQVTDRTGAGDSVFAVLSIFSLVVEDLIVLGYLGNLAGSMNLNWVANEKIITSKDLVNAIHYGLK